MAFTGGTRQLGIRDCIARFGQLLPANDSHLINVGPLLLRLLHFVAEVPTYVSLPVINDCRLR
jgi:hypothetical protein